MQWSKIQVGSLMIKRALTMSAAWGNSENIYSLGVYCP